MRDTIFALATPPGRSAIAVVRVSGPESASALRSLAGRLPEPRRSSLRRLRGADREVFDEALVLWFPGSSGFTGEDAFELHLHGGRATVDAAGRALYAVGLRSAEPGEFSRRAFEAGRLSLTQAEAVADLVEAETEAQRSQALDQLGGALDQRHRRWRDTLVRIAALLEARVDFPDEELPETLGEVERLMSQLWTELGEAGREHRGRQVREGFRVALIGAPNAGKSSLMNALTGRDAAIVTPVPGTTRDVIEAPLVVGGYRMLLADTAGIRGSTDPIELEGVRRARAWADAADMRLAVVDQAGDRAMSTDLLDLLRDGDAIVLAKSDLAARHSQEELGLPAAYPRLRASAVSADGTRDLWGWLATTVADRLGGSDFPVITRERHARHLATARAALEDALASLPLGPELTADDVRRATSALSAVAGKIGVEDVLGEVFATFCIGK